MKKKTFRSKLYSIFIASMILPIIIIAVIFSMFYIKTITVREKKNIEYVLNSIANSIEVQFTELKNISDIYYMQKEVFQEVEALNNPKLYENYDALVRNRMENNYSISIKKSLYKSKQQICDVVFFPINSENGKAYSVDKNHSGLQTILFAGYDKEEWFQEALKTTEKPKFYSNHIGIQKRHKKR